MVEAGAASLAARARELSERKDAAEARMASILEQLQQMPGAPGLDTPLVDDGGFPRTDVGDLYQVRQLRQEFIRLKNDAKQLLSALASALNEVHAAARDSGTARLADAPAERSSAPDDGGLPVRQPAVSPPLTQAWAVVQEVESASPAALAGLAVGDQISKFGDVARPSGTLKELGGKLQQWKGDAVEVWVLREGELQFMTVIPAEWNGPGLLGAKLAAL